MNKKPDDLTEEEWKWECRIFDAAVFVVGIVMFVFLALLMAEKLT